MQWLLPGAAKDRTDAESEPRCSSAASTATPGGVSPRSIGLGRNKAFHTDIWELISGAWKVTHQFSPWLELDSRFHSPDTDDQSRVHLPSTSLRSLQQLHSMFQRPGFMAWDVVPASEPCHSVFSTLLDHLSDVVTYESKVEAISTLRPRAAAAKIARLTVDTDADGVSTLPEDLFAPEKGTEAVDISICPLKSFAGAEPEVALARLAAPADFGAHQNVPVRYAMLVICSSWLNGALALAREVARTFAAAVMDEQFTAALVAGGVGGKDGIIRAFNAYLSNVTIMPTVYVTSESEESENAPSKQKEHLLSDSIVDGIEKLICDARSLPQCNLDVGKKHQPSPGTMQPPSRRRCFFVDVSTIKPGGKWRTTHRLMQGLELDATTQTARPHLPHISVTALARARQLLTPACVGLGVVAADAEAAVNALVHQLSLAGLPLLAVGELTDALTSLIVPDTEELDKGSTKDLGLAAFRKILEPSSREEACHVLTLTCRHFPRNHATVGAFVRIKTPLTVQLPYANIPARFFMVFVASEAAEREVVSIGDSLAALATDEDLMGDLNAVGRAESFIQAFDTRLDNLTLVPHARLSGLIAADGMDNMCVKVDCVEEESEDGKHPSNQIRDLLSRMLAKMQKYSMPLVLGVTIALIWGNVDMGSYEHFTTDPIFEGAQILGHPFSLKFIVNDIFMCFFFGLAIKEVTEALLPGGSLSPLKRAINPLMATVGGVVGPAVAYVAAVLILHSAGSFEGEMCVTHMAGGGGSHRRLGGGGAAAVTGPEEPCTLGALLNGWGVPTATDISLAWMFALLIFGAGHPVINFLLLLAIVDDAMGMIIIATCYPDPDNPVEPVWLLMVLGATVLSFGMRLLKVPFWQPYVLLAGSLSWLGLLEAHVHPALALVFVVPLMPASHAVQPQRSTCDLGACDLGPSSGPRDKAEQVAQHFDVPQEQRISSVATATKILALYHAEEAPLHVFEHTLKLPVDMGMFFFGLSNAGVKLNSVGGITGSVIFALIVGKTLGIAMFGLLAVRMGFGLPAGVTKVDLFAMSAIGGVGLTVALFVSNQAFVDPGLQNQAKFGAVLSVLAAPIAWALKVLPAKLCRCCQVDEVEPAAGFEATVSAVPPDSETQEAAAARADLIEDCLVDDILHILWLQRRYARRGLSWSVHSAAKTPCSIEAGGRIHSSHGLPLVGSTPTRVPSKGLRCRTPMGSEAPGLP